jgi:hypothetical protein
MKMKPIHVSRLTTAWLGVLLIGLWVSPQDPKSTWNRAGPSANLAILGVRVDTPGKYLALIVYLVLNTIVRSTKNTVLQSWLTLNVQDESRSLEHVNKAHAYEISLLVEVHGWVDWLINLSVLVSQIDVFLVTVLCEITVALYLTRYYLSIPERQCKVRPPVQDPEQTRASAELPL